MSTSSVRSSRIVSRVSPRRRPRMHAGPLPSSLGGASVARPPPTTGRRRRVAGRRRRAGRQRSADARDRTLRSPAAVAVHARADGTEAAERGSRRAGPERGRGRAAPRAAPAATPSIGAGCARRSCSIAHSPRTATAVPPGPRIPTYTSSSLSKARSVRFSGRPRSLASACTPPRRSVRSSSCPEREPRSDQAGRIGVDHPPRASQILTRTICPPARIRRRTATSSR